MKIRIDSTITTRVERAEAGIPAYCFRFDGDGFEIEASNHEDTDKFRFSPSQLGQLIEFARFCQSTQAPDTGKVVEL